MELTERKSFSKQKLKELKNSFEKSEAFKNLPSVTCYAVGSLGRLEASSKSDIDAFFVNMKNPEHCEGINLKKIRMFSEFIQIAEKLDFPEISNDGQFLEVLNLNDMKKNFGAPADDFDNLFTARMLLLLESKCIYNNKVYTKVLREVLKTYFKDFDEHPNCFEHRILLNDIVRYWKTLCLNHENKRNKSKNGNDDPNVQIKAIKLKFSRMITYFGTIISICATKDLTEEKFLTICKMVPLERIEYIIDNNCEEQVDLFNQLNDSYKKFLDYCNDFNHCKISTETDQIQNDSDCFSKTLDEILRKTSKNKGQLRRLLL